LLTAVIVVQALTAHLKSKLLTFPGHDPQHSQFDTRDEAVRARFGLYALNQRAAEAVTIRAWATEQLQGQGQERQVLVCGDLNDTPQAATTQLLLSRPGSQLGTGGSTSRTGVTATGCGTWPPRCPPATR
jgi:endonuclease/exonuclease/phosphatase family metal-dependent hydrolase